MIQFEHNVTEVAARILRNSQQFQQEARNVVQRSTLSAEAYAKQLAAVKTGRLRSSILSRFENGGLTGVVEATAAHAAFVEFPTRPHIIRPRSARMLRFKNRHGVWTFAKQVRHTGTQAQPFMQPALQQEKPQFERDLREAVRRCFQ